MVFFYLPLVVELVKMEDLMVEVLMVHPELVVVEI